MYVCMHTRVYTYAGMPRSLSLSLVCVCVCEQAGVCAYAILCFIDLI